METSLSPRESREERILRKIKAIQDAAKERLKTYGSLTIRDQMKLNSSIAYLQEALERIRTGNGDICKDCGGSIPAKRLELVPGAIRCAECQSTLDDRRKDRGVRNPFA